MSQTLQLAFKKLQSLRDQFARLDKDVRGLKDLLNVHDNWHSTIRQWIGKMIAVCDRNGVPQDGKLMWSDRYNLCIEIPPATELLKGKTRVYTKGGINWIEKRDDGK